MTRRLPQRSRSAATRRRAGLWPAIELLEARQLLATFTVNAFTDAAAVNPSTGDATSTLGAGRITLRSAIQAADATAGAGTINLPAGTYTLSIAPTGADDAASGDLNITGSLTLTGAGASSTIINANKIDRVLSVTGTGTVAISGVTITGGDDTATIPNNLSFNGGGGIHLQAATLTLNDCAVNGNVVNDYGGGGGGIFNEGGQLTLNGTIVDSNAAYDKTQGYLTLNGGGIYARGGQTMLFNSTVSRNGVGAGANNARFVAHNGGGIYNGSGGFLRVTDSTVRDNFMGGDYGGLATGGGIYNAGQAVLTRSTISGNNNLGNGYGTGGGVANVGGLLDIFESTISGNITGGNGGGVLSSPPTGTPGAFVTAGSVTDSTIAGNTALVGGGLYFNDTRLFALKNTILAANFIDFASGPNYAQGPNGGITSVGHNLSSDTSAAAVFTAPGDLNNVDAKLGPLADNGGPTFTQALLAGSPAIDAGDSAGAPATDQRGLPRIHGANIDIGAYEYASADATTTTLASSQPSSQFGAPVTLTATVNKAAGSTGTPSGTVTFLEGTTPLGSGTIDTTNGVATLPIATLAVGPHAITAVYAGDANFATSTSEPIPQTVTRRTTVTTVSSSAATAAAGQDVVFTASVDAVAYGPGGAPADTVTFTVDGGAPTSVPIAVVNGHGQASFDTTKLGAGTHAVVAAYSGGTEYAPSVSQPFMEKVTPVVSQKTPTAITVVLPTRSSVGSNSVITAALALPPGTTATPTGTVTITVDGKPTTIAIDPAKGSPQLAVPFLKAGPHRLSVAFSGDANFGPSQSAVTTISVAPDATTTTLTSAPNPAAAGQPVTFTADVSAAVPLSPAAVVHGRKVHARQTPPPPGFPPYAGTVYFRDGSTILGSARVHADGTAVFTTSALAPGTHAVTADYEFDPNYAPSTSNVVPQAVGAAVDGPRVVSVRRYGYHRMPTTLVVGFDAPLDRASSQDAANYRVTDANGAITPVVSASYDAGPHTVTLTPLSRLDLHKRYTVTVVGTGAGGVKGAAGSLLDGASTGRAGSNYVTTVDAANLVVINPFAAGATAALKLAAQVRAADAWVRP